MWQFINFADVTSQLEIHVHNIKICFVSSLNQSQHENLHICVTPFMPSRAEKGQIPPIAKAKRPYFRWLFFFLLWAIRIATGGQAAGYPATVYLPAELNTTQATLAVIGLLEDITALLSGWLQNEGNPDSGRCNDTIVLNSDRIESIIIGGGRKSRSGGRTWRPYHPELDDLDVLWDGMVLGAAKLAEEELALLETLTAEVLLVRMFALSENLWLMLSMALNL
jgi:hypothetical protein